MAIDFVEYFGPESGRQEHFKNAHRGWFDQLVVVPQWKELGSSMDREIIGANTVTASPV